MLMTYRSALRVYYCASPCYDVPVNRFAAMDEPVALSQLIDAKQLADVLGSIIRLHPVAISVSDRKGVLLCERGETSSEIKYRQALEYNGDIVGHITLRPTDSSRGSGEQAEVLEGIADHVATMLQVVLHSSFARHLTTTIHEAAMEESFSELSDRNERLASAIERLEELERLKSNFLATISHELRTPLTSIIGYSEMLTEGLAGDLNEEQSDYVSTILSKSEHLLQLITGILDVSLIEARSLRLAIKPVHLGELIASVAATLQRDLARRSIVLELPNELVPRARGDAGKLRQVVLHLLANAIKFSPDGGDVKVSVKVGPLSPEDRSSPTSPFWQGNLSERFGLRVTVTDDGIGIPSEQRASIFEPFFQVDSGSTRAFGGTGLGLSLAKSYVIAHGGFLWLDSAVSSKGSAFSFTLPAVENELESYISQTLAPIAP